MIEELQETRHVQSKAYGTIHEAVMGPENCLRRKAAKSGLNVELQVDVLIEHATDPNILGRTWIGWLPHV
jgi:DNA-dependent protein kinase catalytic subunit